jgi:hypothetical protein
MIEQNTETTPLSFVTTIEEGRAAIKVLIKNLAIFFLCPSKHAVSTDITPNSPVGISMSSYGILISWLPHKFRSLKI